MISLSYLISCHKIRNESNWHCQACRLLLLECFYMLTFYIFILELKNEEQKFVSSPQKNQNPKKLKFSINFAMPSMNLPEKNYLKYVYEDQESQRKNMA